MSCSSPQCQTLANRQPRLKQWVSLKIPVADGSSRELSVLQSLQRARAAHRVVRLLDAFVHEGPNGSHQCLVFELLGPTVDFIIHDYQSDGERLEERTVVKITRRLLQGLAAIHGAGYAHGGLFVVPTHGKFTH